MDLHWYEIAFGVFCLSALLTWLFWPVRKKDDDLEDVADDLKFFQDKDKQ